MTKQEILINVSPYEVRVALVQASHLKEIYIERCREKGVLGNIYQGKISRLLPGLQAAFVEIGEERTAFLHFNDIKPYAEILSPGQTLLVQVIKDPLGSKGARLTTHLTLPGRYLILTSQGRNIAVSQKITDMTVKNRLIKRLSLPKQGGYIVRTAAEHVAHSEIEAEKDFLEAVWRDILTKAAKTQGPALVYAEISMVERVLRDLARSDIQAIRVDDIDVYNRMRVYAKKRIPDLYDKIIFFSENHSIFDLYAIETELNHALQRKINLKSGGYLIFDQTEAMTTIDVNTGSFLSYGKVEETLFRTNCEAASMIARQVRLRNIGGIIIIDFIDMSDLLQKRSLLDLLRTELAKDPAKTEISELSSLNLVQMTRKRVRDSLQHNLCVPCHSCQKRGYIKSLETICYEIFREIEKRVRQK